MPATFSLDWAYASGQPAVSGLFRCTPEDFCVDEELGFEPEGGGEHVYLQLQKRGDNTAWLARQIAKLAGVEGKDVGYAGLKDRHAVTRQWFSVYLPKGPEPDWQQLQSDSVQLLAVSRHPRKLRRGAHLGNRFRIRLHQLQGELDSLAARLAQVAERGVPNYFGPQRFGIDGGNLHAAQRLLVEGVRIRNRQQRGLFLSAARSWLFNQVLDLRLREHLWPAPLAGDVVMPAAGDERTECGSGPLWGRGRSLVSGDCLALEQRALSGWEDWCEGLEHVGLSQERRALWLRPADFHSRVAQGSLELSFVLPPGTFATAVLREIAQLKEVSVPVDMV